MSDMNDFNNPPELEADTKKPVKRNKGKIVIITMIVVFVVTGIAALGFAKGFYDKHKGGGPWGFMIGRIADDLDLNTEQKAAVDKIKEEIKAKMDANKESRKKDMTEMEQMFRSDNFDKQKALDFAKLHDAKREEMRSFMIDEVAKFHSILTPDQRNKAVDKMKEFREKDKGFKDGWKDKKQDR
ncbi:MAG: Spy/CpxP family protein refolding chaperone [Ignavibacteria bacterium]|nr:Spy/CpxP family protein refolding chaperone [Ignavibacteria bacterium]